MVRPYQCQSDCLQCSRICETFESEYGIGGGAELNAENTALSQVTGNFLTSPKQFSRPGSSESALHAVATSLRLQAPSSGQAPSHLIGLI